MPKPPFSASESVSFSVESLSKTLSLASGPQSLDSVSFSIPALLTNANVFAASLRAYGAQEAFIEESMNRINRYTRAARTFYNLNRWVCIRIDAMGGLFSSGLAAYLLYYRSHGAANTGFSLNMAGKERFFVSWCSDINQFLVGFSGMILWWIRMLNDFEVQGNRYCLFIVHH